MALRTLLRGAPLLVLLVPLAAQEPTATSITESARALLPAYEGDPRSFLTAAEGRRVRAASLMLEAASVLEPESTYTLWWWGHAAALLAADRRNRGDLEQAEADARVALGALDRALAQDPASYWAYYARGIVQTNRRAYEAALADFAAAVERADQAAAAAPNEAARTDALFVRFKTRRWKCEVLMRVLHFDEARAEWRAFYADNGNNQWDLGYSLAEAYLRERDYAGARATYEHVLETPEFVPFSSTHDQLGYLAGLQGRTADAVRHLEESLTHEMDPSLYTRLWLWILCEETDRARYEADLAGLLEHPPASIGEWDARLGRYSLGEGTDEEFLEAARAELARRMEAAEEPGDLLCEVWFYVGNRRHRRADSAGSDDERARLRRAAADAYLQALAEDPPAFKWEWEYARNGLARVAGELALTATPPFRLADGSFTADPTSPLVHATGASAGRPVLRLRHTVGRDGPLRDAPALEAPFQVGDLLQVTLESGTGEPGVVRLVVGGG